MTVPCPCGAGPALGDCCGPYLEGLREPPDAVALMRSRYTAFAVGATAHLWRTLHPAHEDRARPEREVLRALEKACKRFKYRGLWILDHAEGPTGRAEVLFLVKLWETGKDRSFVERSAFERDGAGWRYRSGQMLPVAALEGDPKALTLASFPPR